MKKPRLGSPGVRFHRRFHGDGEGLVSRAGSALLAWMADRLCFTAALSEGLAGIRERRGLHDSGRVVRDLAVTLADDGECVVDIGGMREQALLFGLIASDSTAWRTIAAIAAKPERLEAIRTARKARASAPGQPVPRRPSPGSTSTPP